MRVIKLIIFSILIFHASNSGIADNKFSDGDFMVLAHFGTEMGNVIVKEGGVIYAYGIISGILKDWEGPCCEFQKFKWNGKKFVLIKSEVSNGKEGWDEMDEGSYYYGGKTYEYFGKDWIDDSKPIDISNYDWKDLIRKDADVFKVIIGDINKDGEEDHVVIYSYKRNQGEGHYYLRGGISIFSRRDDHFYTDFKYEDLFVPHLGALLLKDVNMDGYDEILFYYTSGGGSGYANNLMVISKRGDFEYSEYECPNPEFEQMALDRFMGIHEKYKNNSKEEAK